MEEQATGAAAVDTKGVALGGKRLRFAPLRRRNASKPARRDTETSHPRRAACPPLVSKGHYTGCGPLRKHSSGLAAPIPCLLA